MAAIRERFTRRPRLLTTLLAGAATLAAYVPFEVVYRLHRYRELASQDALSRVRILEAPLVRFDRQLGFRYIPGTVTRHLTIDSQNRVAGVNTIRVNNMGRVSPRDDTLEKPAFEYRIAVIGDSFTACTFNDTPWPITMEDLLAGDGTLAGRLGRVSFKVMNFGMDATGVVQWPPVYDVEVARFRPDLLVVAFIENDLWRAFKWMAGIRPDAHAPYEIVIVSESLPVTLDNPRAFLSWRVVIRPPHADDPDARRRLVKAALSAKLHAMPWLVPRPELVAGLLSGAHVPAPDFLMPRLSFRPDRRPRWDTLARLRVAVRAMEGLAARMPTVFLHLPTRTELERDMTPAWLSELRNAAPGLAIRSLRTNLQSLAARGAAERWYLPDNGHLTDAGARAYAQAAYAEVREHLMSTSAPVSDPRVR